MKRLLTLASVLRKCGNGSEEGSKMSANQMDIFLYIIIALVSVGTFFLGRQLTALQQILPDPYAVMQVLTMLGAVISLILMIPGMFNGLYMSKDITVLLTLPYSANELVFVRILNMAKQPFLIVFAATVPTGIGFALVNNVETTFYIAILLAFICAPLITISALGIVVILLMSLIKVMRSRDALKVVGAIVALAALAFYMIVIQNHQLSADMLTQAVSMLNSFVNVLPISFAVRAMMGGELLLPLAEVLGITAAFLLVFILVTRALYLNGALSMQDSSSVGKALDAKELKRRSRRHTIFRAFYETDFKRTRRNPSFLMNGYLYPIAMPIILVIIYCVAGGSGVSLINFSMAASFTGTLSVSMACVGAMVPIAAMSSAVANTPISREGETFMLLRQLPVSLKTMVRAKEKASMVTAVGPSLVYILVGGLVTVFVFGLQIWGVLYALVLGFGLGMTMVDLCMIRDLKKPFLNWESESAMLKASNCVPAIILGMVLLLGLLVLSILLVLLSSFAVIILIATLVLAVILATTLHLRLMHLSDELAIRLRMTVPAEEE